MESESGWKAKIGWWLDNNKFEFCAEEKSPIMAEVNAIYVEGSLCEW